jgi:RecB family exonuclease
MRYLVNSYNPQRTRNLFVKTKEAPFKLSRSKIEDFLNCPRCFYLDRKCGTGRPPGYPFTLNTAVDTLFKCEFDKYREEGRPHPLCIKNSLQVVPFSHPDLDDWRANFKGIQHFHELTNFIITGAVDDIWINEADELIVVDYKATSTSKEITLDEEYRQSYKRQMEIYQWLLRKKGFKVSNTGYFVYCNGDATKDSFDGRLEFSIVLLPYVGNDSWIEQVLLKIRECLFDDSIPDASENCDFCSYWSAIKNHLDASSN